MLLSNALLWCCLFFNYFEFVILGICSIVGLGIVRSESVNIIQIAMEKKTLFSQVVTEGEERA